MSESNKNNREDKDRSSEQRIVLEEIRQRHAEQIREIPGFLDTVVQQIRLDDTQWRMPDGGLPVVVRRIVGTEEVGTPQGWRELLQIAIGTPDQSGVVSRGATVAYRVHSGKDAPVYTFSDFTEHEAELVSACVDELALAQLSGQIPALSSDYSRIDP